MKAPIHILPLGGLGEVGKNMCALEYDGDIIIIDAGVQFPRGNSVGVDAIVPDMGWIKANANKVRGLLITHGHEDHIGAIPHLLKTVNVPVFAPPMAMELISGRLEETHLLKDADLNIVNDGTNIRFGNMTAEWFGVRHSIPDSMGIVVDTPIGRIVHTGDFKIDNNPVYGEPTNFTRLAELARSGVMLLMSDSTYAGRKGYSGSDGMLASSILDLAKNAEGRLFIASFASQIARIQIVANTADTLGKKLAFAARRMAQNADIAENLGHIFMPDGVKVPLSKALAMKGDDVIVMVSGAQGEPTSSLSRLSRNAHKGIRVRAGDTVIISSTPIPGSEVAVQAVINNLTLLGARVITNTDSITHVRGHAHREELRIYLNILKPKYFIPIHGEYRMLKSHAELAIEQGVEPERVFLMTDGDVLALGTEGGKITDRISLNNKMIRGRSMQQEDEHTLAERLSLAHNGVVYVTLAREKGTNYLIGTPEIDSAGVAGNNEIKEILKDAQNTLSVALEEAYEKNLEWKGTEKLAIARLSRLFARKIGRHPFIFVKAVEI